MSESIKRWVPIPTGVEVDVGTYGTDELDTEEIAYLLRVGGIDARSVGQAVSSAQERAAEVIRSMFQFANPRWQHNAAQALAEANLLVDDDTARLVEAVRVVEPTITPHLESLCMDTSDDNALLDQIRAQWGFVRSRLDAIYREAGVEPLDSASHRPPDSPTRPETPPDGTPVAPEPSQGDTGAVSGGAG